MFCERETPRGRVSIDKAVLGGIIRRETDLFEGKVLLSDAKGRPIKNPGRDMGFFEFSWAEGLLDLRVFVIIRMGTSINAVATGMIRGLSDSLASIADVRPGGVSIIVKGVLSRNISRRDIEVTAQNPW
ncbi:MAG: hypothetical protein LBS32_05565 [Clostridiales Family XIII bacterium]|jgi:uncharacterized alkaline shock family protein YloU|nr:hypothetical protein [Clostridiales Family XIII bacterium]